VLFDVEGFFCPKKQDSAHDLKLFALASLTSSMLIYNTLATINSCGLSDLHFGSQLSREFIPESKNLSELSKYYPILVWTIRDHFLDLTVEKNGQTIEATSDEYMEDCLEQKNDLLKNWTRTLSKLPMIFWSSSRRMGTQKISSVRMEKSLQRLSRISSTPFKKNISTLNQCMTTLRPPSIRKHLIKFIRASERV